MTDTSKLEAVHGPVSPIVWRDAETWVPEIGAWIQDFLEPNAISLLKSIHQDDPMWREEVPSDERSDELEDVVEQLAKYLETRTVRVYHGCRVDDVGVYLKEGLKISNLETCKDQVRKIVSEEPDLAWRLPTLENHLAIILPNESEQGISFVGLDDRLLTGECSHYALYGSECVMAIIGSSGYNALRRRGVPSILEIDLPLHRVSISTLIFISRAFLREWVNFLDKTPEEVRLEEISIGIDENIPGTMIVDHYHPAVLNDIYQENKKVKTVSTRCPSCP